MKIIKEQIVKWGKIPFVKTRKRLNGEWIDSKVYLNYASHWGDEEIEYE